MFIVFDWFNSCTRLLLSLLLLSLLQFFVIEYTAANTNFVNEIVEQDRLRPPNRKYVCCVFLLTPTELYVSGMPFP